MSKLSYDATVDATCKRCKRKHINEAAVESGSQYCTSFQKPMNSHAECTIMLMLRDIAIQSKAPE